MAPGLFRLSALRVRCPWTRFGRVGGGSAGVRKACLQCRAKGDENLREYSDYGVTISKQEEQRGVQAITQLLYAGDALDEKVREAVSNGTVDKNTLVVLYHKLKTANSNDGEGGDGPRGSQFLQALSVLYSKLLYEFEKRNISPAMKVLDEALEIMLDEAEGETERLLEVNQLLNEKFYQADLGVDPLSAAHIFAQAQADQGVQDEIDSYLSGRMSRETFVYEVRERLDTLKAEFNSIDANTDAGANEEQDWIDQRQTQAEKGTRNKVLKYVSYILSLAEGSEM